MREQDLSPEERERLRLHVLKSQAVRQATFEVIGESRDEIVKRARAKLVALGVSLSDEEAESQL